MFAILRAIASHILSIMSSNSGMLLAILIGGWKRHVGKIACRLVEALTSIRRGGEAGCAKE